MRTKADMTSCSNFEFVVGEPGCLYILTSIVNWFSIIFKAFVIWAMAAS
jgi:hypothetical protein